jgi:hypothetical protein
MAEKPTTAVVPQVIAALIVRLASEDVTEEPTDASLSAVQLARQAERASRSADAWRWLDDAQRRLADIDARKGS